MLGGCSKDVEPDNQSSQNNTGYHNENSSSNQNNGTRDVLNDADYIGYITISSYFLFFYPFFW